MCLLYFTYITQFPSIKVAKCCLYKSLKLKFSELRKSLKLVWMRKSYAFVLSLKTTINIAYK